MSLLSSLRSAVSALVYRSQWDGDLDQELRAHVENRADHFERSGLTRAEAERRARLEFGGHEKFKEECREALGARFLGILLRDVRFGLRMFGKSPGFTAVAVLTLAMAIAVNTTIFSTVSAFFLRKPPVRDPDRIVVVSSVNPAKGAFAPDRTGVSALDYLDWQAQSSSFAGMAAADFEDFTLSGRLSPERLAGARVSSNFFQVLGVAPAMGQAFLPEENVWGRDHSVILNDALWNERFGADPRVLGSLVKINGKNFTVAGVMPRSFHLWDFEAQIWIPLTFSPDDLRPTSPGQVGPFGRSWRYLHVFARRKPGTEERQATAEMKTIAERIAQAHKDTNEGWGASVMSLQRYSTADSNSDAATAFLMAAVGFVLLIASTNLATLMLARNSARRREFTVRCVLGAGRFRLARQLLTECLLLSIAGGALGTLGAFWGVRALRAQFNWNEYARVMAGEIFLDERALLFTVALSLGAGVLFGLAPAIQMARGNATDSLKEASRGSTQGAGRHRLQHLLVIGQMALSLFFLAGAGLFVEGFLEEIRASAGFNSHNLLTASVSLDDLKYFEPQPQRQFFENVLERIRNLPGAESAALATDLPFNSPGYMAFTVEGHAVTKPEEQPTCGWFAVSPGHFATLEVPLLQGREFTSSDTADAPPVVIVNQAFAKRFLGTENAMGHHIRLGLSDKNQNPWSEIVGVVGNVKESLGQVRPPPQIFVPFAAHPSRLMRFILRTKTDPASLSDSLRHAVWAVDPDQAVTEMRTMDRVIKDSGTGDDLVAELMGGFALLALLIAVVGIFGVLSHLVEQRTQEMGIRLALGAEPAKVLALVIRQGMALVGTGSGIGVLFSFALPKLVAAGFDNFKFHSPWVLVLAPIVVLVVGFLACYVPARRAMQVDPMVALRYE